MQFHHVGDGGVELADAVLLALVVAFEIEADGLEDQGDAGRGVLQVGDERRGIAGAGGARNRLRSSSAAAARPRGSATSALTTQMRRSEANRESARASSRISASVSFAEIVLR